MRNARFALTTPGLSGTLLNDMPIPVPVWSRPASNQRGTLRVIPVTLPQSNHYVLTLNHMPVDDHDDVSILISRAAREWAVPETALT